MHKIRPRSTFPDPRSPGGSTSQRTRPTLALRSALQHAPAAPNERLVPQPFTTDRIHASTRTGLRISGSQTRELARGDD